MNTQILINENTREQTFDSTILPIHAIINHNSTISNFQVIPEAEQNTEDSLIYHSSDQETYSQYSVNSSSDYESFGEEYEPSDENYESDDNHITATKCFPW